MFFSSRIKVTLILFFLSLSLYAQDASELQTAQLNNPYETVYSHLYFLQTDSYKPTEAAKTINVSDPERAKKLAIQLKQILDGKGLYIDLEIIPTDADFVDTTTGKNRYVLLHNYPDIYLEKVDGRWLYSRRTVEIIPVMHKEIYPFGSDMLVNLIPGKFGHQDFLGLEVWQWIGILMLILIIGIMHFILRRLIDWSINKIARRVNKYFTGNVELIHKASKPLSFFFITMIVVKLLPILQLPIGVAKYVVIFFEVLTPLFGTIFAYYLVDLLMIYFKRIAGKTETTLDDQLMPLLSRTIKVLVIAIGGVIILHKLNFNITALIAGVSIGGLALALAAQDTIKNLFGSVMIFVDRPFQIGDWINAAGFDGTVEEVGFRSTRIRTFQNSVVSIPNGQLADMAINNMGLRRYRRFNMKIALTYDTPPHMIELFVEGLREIVVNNRFARKDYYEVHFNEMGDTSLNILLYMFFDVPSWTEELKGRHEVLLDIMKLAENLGVRFAFPTQTIHIEDFPEKKTLVPVYAEDVKSLRERLAVFLKEIKEQDRDKNMQDSID